MVYFSLPARSTILIFDLIFIPGFFSLEIKQGHLYGSLIDILRNSAPIIVLAMGMTLVIATGGVDLSVGAVMAIASSVACIMINPAIIGMQLSGDITNLVSDPSFSYTPLWAVILLAPPIRSTTPIPEPRTARAVRPFRGN